MHRSKTQHAFWLFFPVLAVVLAAWMATYIMAAKKPKQAQLPLDVSPSYLTHTSLLEQEENSPQLPSFTEQDNDSGYYYGQEKEKRVGTPESWKHELEGTRGARWYDPNKQ